MDITAIFVVTFGMLAIITILFVLVYFGRKKERYFVTNPLKKVILFFFFLSDWYFEL